MLRCVLTTEKNAVHFWANFAFSRASTEKIEFSNFYGLEKVDESKKLYYFQKLLQIAQFFEQLESRR